jgi:ComF family protein
MVKSIFRGLLNFALPNTCLACGEVLGAESNFICSSCHSKLVPFSEAHPWKAVEISQGTIDDSFSLYKFIAGTEIQTLLHSMKYEKMKSIGRMFGKEIGSRVANSSDVDYGFAIPVPLHRAKERERTYNQSHWICRGICDVLNAKLIDKCLKRIRFTQTQTKLHKTERQKNVHGAFEISPKFKDAIAGRNIILADDVITTGSTILECARVLKQSGAGKVMICSIAYDALD